MTQKILHCKKHEMQLFHTSLLHTTASLCLQRRDICPIAVGFDGAGGIAQRTKPRWNMQMAVCSHHMEYPGTECLIYIYTGAQSLTLGCGIQLLRNATACWNHIRS